jgi:S-adenosylmethionine:tRNA ribosyltransferase-isomerase
MRVSNFDFDLPPERIALRPADPRESARLLVVGDRLHDHVIADFPSLLRAGDVLVFNDTKVLPAALTGKRIGRLGTTPKIEVLLHQRLDSGKWTAFAKPAKKLAARDRLQFGELTATVAEKREAGEIILHFDQTGQEFEQALVREGKVPLPPYIESRRAQDEQDRRDYQTVYADRGGAVAAPTAGLHFTAELLSRLRESGIQMEFLTLHVGAGTFLPVKTDDTKDHRMHGEWGEVSAEVSSRLKLVQVEGRRIIAVGTTSLRLLEASKMEPFSGITDIFITPGYKFSTADALITNFHLPRSTLFMLVCAFAGLERMKRAYAHAIASNYRFYSYGDACLLFRDPR